MAVHIADPILRAAVIADLHQHANRWKQEAAEARTPQDERTFRRQAAVLESYAIELEETARTSVH